ncbi:hypothetical protein A11A3_07038 [Alcanivorax hongdengensis A-11-3]|uniref:DUF4124 domain-containing protein n=1 Tax=Alcanivorax hongdengensis A-11-3 TaxID=1177179 RepID=L0WDB2_9GAMM|nr:DUF4124 domain-containing protein [Alcanivorax hongdengensis]EKF74758.1 hypothetical protein A11A3_07038 [Alcanivorax hongdengensis A-11-3]
MRYLIIVIVLVAAVMAALFTLPVKNGNPVLNWQYVRDNWQQPQRWLDHPQALVNGRTDGSAELYRWRDRAGNWQYGQIPPAGVRAETVTVKAPTTMTSEDMRGGKRAADEQQH